jgi:hypothetical protein
MARKSPTALDALNKLRDERRELDKREAEIRSAAALELGLIALEAGADRLDAATFRAAITRALAG